jgi:hypothetical protein
MRRVGRDHHVAAFGLDPHALQALGVAADPMHRDAGGDLTGAVMKFNPACEHLAHHGDHVVHFEREPQRRMAHTTPGRITHLGLLQMIASAREQLVVAGMVVVQVRDDDVLDRLWVDPDRLQPLTDRIRDQALALLRHGLVEASIDDKGTVRADDRPDKVIERLQHIVRVAADEILRRFAIVVPIADRVDIMNVIGHCSHPGFGLFARTSTPA